MDLVTNKTVPPEHNEGAVISNMMVMYRGLSGRIHRWNMWRFARRSGLAHLPKGARILDCACGTGDLQELMRRAGFHGVEGFDASREMCIAGAACGNFIKNGTVATMREGRDASSYDAVVFSNALHHLTGEAEVSKALSDAAYLLAPGGSLFIREWYPTRITPCWLWLSRFRWLHQVPIFGPHIAVYEIESAERKGFWPLWARRTKLLQEAGFAITSELDIYVHRITIAVKT